MAKMMATMVVALLFTSLPMMDLSALKSSRGMMGNGRRMLSTAWLYTSTFRGSMPRMMAMVRGMRLMNRVMTRLTQSGILKSVSPSMTDWPASVPVMEEEMPAESRAIANTRAARLPNSGIRVTCAPSSVATLSPRPKNAAAAMMSMDALISAAIARERTSSVRWYSSFFLIFPPSVSGKRSRAGCRRCPAW